MVVGVVIFKFEMNRTSLGNIEPEFEVIVSKFAHGQEGMTVEDLMTVDDKFSLYFNHTTGMSMSGPEEEDKDNLFMGRLKENPYKVISYFHQEVDESQYLIISFYALNEEVELFEVLAKDLLVKLKVNFAEMMKGNIEDVTFLNQMKQKMDKEVSYNLYQQEQLSDLKKIQKVGLIFRSPARVKILQALRKGPISRVNLQYVIESVKANANLDILLRPFVELNIIRRDWAEGYEDRKTGERIGSGEHIFLVKDIALIRIPPEELVKNMKKNERVGKQFLDKMSFFYKNYDPFEELDKQSVELAPLLLEPDLFNLMNLLKDQTYPLSKMPKITSEYVNIEELLKKLHQGKVIIYIKDDENLKWVLLLSEISAIVTFPEYLIKTIAEGYNDKAEGSEHGRIPKEIAIKALEQLEATQGEKIEF